MNARRSLLVTAVVTFAAGGLAFSCGGVATNGLGPIGDAGGQDATVGGGCVPGQQVACACVGGGVTGVQTCKPGGDGFAACRGCPGGNDAGGNDAGSGGGDAAPPGSDGSCGSLSSVDNCGACGQACDTSTGSPACNGTTCAYACNVGRSDCNLHTAPDTDGCECATPGCCGTGCQTSHSSGIGQSFYDCVEAGTHTQPQARAACVTFTGDAGACKTSSACCDDSLGLCITVQSTDAICGAASGTCHCWSYLGHDSGTVQTPDAGCAEICPSAGDPGWN